jgi:hypothetical protein
LKRVEVWLDSMKSAEPDWTEVTLTVSGRPGHTTLLEGILIDVRKRSTPPPRGGATVIQLPSQCGGYMNPREFHASLDDAISLFRPNTGEKTNFPYTLSPSDSELFHLILITRHCDCTWALKLVTRVDGKLGFSPFPTNGTTYHTEPSTGYDRRAWGHPQDGSARLVPAPFDNTMLTMPHI